MPGDQLQVLYEDNHLLVVNKPAGLPTMGVSEETPSLLAMARQYVKRRYNKPGNVYLGAMSRLDAPVSGAILFARTSKAAARLTEQFRGREVEKVYWAIVERRPAANQVPAQLNLRDFVRKDERHRRMHLAASDTPGAQEARMSLRRLAEVHGGTLVEVRLETGRKHQIRLQLASQGWPVLGDRKYGARQSFPAGIALHSRRLTFIHPTRGDAIDVVATLPSAWRKFMAGFEYD